MSGPSKSKVAALGNSTYAQVPIWLTRMALSDSALQLTSCFS